MRQSPRRLATRLALGYNESSGSERAAGVGWGVFLAEAFTKDQCQQVI